MTLPAKYNLLLLVISALVYPVLGLLVGGPFTDPSVMVMVIVPVAIVIGANLGDVDRSRSGNHGVLDERDGRNIDLALTAAGGVLLLALVVIYTGYAATEGTAPNELDYLALVGLLTVFCVLGGTEVYQRF